MTRRWCEQVLAGLLAVGLGEGCARTPPEAPAAVAAGGTAAGAARGAEARPAGGEGAAAGAPGEERRGERAGAAGQPQRAETEACEQERRAIGDEATRSRQRACAAAAECVTVVNPAHPSRELRMVVHRQDGARLEERAQAHLQACGAAWRHEALDAVRVVRAECARSRCQESVTTMHLQNPGE